MGRLRAIVVRHIDEWVSELSDRHRHVVETRYGLNGRDVVTLETLAQELGITRERVRQIQNIALNKLRKMIEKLEASRHLV